MFQQNLFQEYQAALSQDRRLYRCREQDPCHRILAWRRLPDVVTLVDQITEDIARLQTRRESYPGLPPMASACRPHPKTFTKAATVGLTAHYEVGHRPPDHDASPFSILSTKMVARRH